MAEFSLNLGAGAIIQRKQLPEEGTALQSAVRETVALSG